MNKNILISLILLSSVLINCDSYSDLNNIPEPVKTTIRNAVKNKHRVGISLALVNKQGVQYYSYGNLRSSDATAINENSILGVGSLSKVFTSLVFANMVANSEINPQTPVNNYLPSIYQTPSSETNTMTLQHLVTHTSGLPKNLQVHDSPDSLYKAVSAYSYPSRYGDKYIYSSIGMALLGHILEIQSGQKLDQLVLERITGPLQMQRSTYHLDNTLEIDLAQGHLESKPLSRAQMESNDLGFIYGGLYSSTLDLAKLVNAYLTDSTTTLSPTLALTQQKHHDGITGFGWKIKNFKSTDIFYHGGQQPGYQSFFGFNKKQGVGVVLMANSQNQDDIQNIAIHLLSNGDVPLPNFSLPKEVALAPEYLNRYVGVYQSVDSPEETNSFEISIENSKLFCVERTFKGEIIRESTLYAKNETAFFLKDIPLTANFKINNDSKNVQLSLDFQNKTYLFERIR